MAQNDPVGGKDTAYAKGDYSNKQLKKDAARGMETPSTRTKGEYRQDMARQDYYNQGGSTTGPTPKRYYENFDRGATKDARKRATKRGSK
jgi:hypothetical protein